MEKIDGSLAINGGSPVRDITLPYGRQQIDEEDIRLVVDVLRSDWLTTGPAVAEFEEAFAQHLAVRYAVAFSSGTAALHGAVFAAGLGPQDEAITTPMTFCGSANCVIYQGARPVFADVTPDTLNIDPDEIRRQITPRTKVIIPVDYAGHPVDLSAVLKIADSRGLTVIEDACHALGATYDGKPIGSLSHMSVFSFHPVKVMTTGEGGMVTTNSADFANRLKTFRNHGIDTDGRERQNRGKWFYEMTELGYNYRITDFQCALGMSQLRKLPAFLETRRAIARRYDQAFQNVRGLSPLGVRSNVSHAYHLYVIQLLLEDLQADRDQILAALRSEGIGANVHYIPVHLHPYYQRELGTQPGSYPIAEAAYERMLSLPIFPAMTQEDIDDVIAAVRKVMNYYFKPDLDPNTRLNEGVLPTENTTSSVGF